MTAATSSPLSDVSRRVLQVQVITLIWMSVEAIVSLGTAWTSHSPALLAFGGVRLVAVISPARVFWGFLFPLSQGRGARIRARVLFSLAAVCWSASALAFLVYPRAHR